jgi:predicted kinase
MPGHKSKDQTSSTPPTLVIVCGLPATGKSSLAETLRDELGWPLFAKDHFKELLYDAANTDEDIPEATRTESMEKSQESIALLYAIAYEVLRAGVSCIIEANFRPHLARADMAPLLAMANGRQVHCSIPEGMVLERYRERSDAGDRHPIHVETGAEKSLIEGMVHGEGDPLPLDVPLLEVDSSEGWDPDIPAIVAFCKS